MILRDNYNLMCADFSFWLDLLVDALPEIAVLVWLRHRHQTRIYVQEFDARIPKLGRFGHSFPNLVNNQDNSCTFFSK